MLRFLKIIFLKDQMFAKEREECFEIPFWNGILKINELNKTCAEATQVHFSIQCFVNRSRHSQKFSLGHQKEKKRTFCTWCSSYMWPQIPNKSPKCTKTDQNPKNLTRNTGPPKHGGPLRAFDVWLTPIVHTYAKNIHVFQQPI
jgi:hypothetical protein